MQNIKIILDTLRNYDYINTCELIEIAKGKNELVTNCKQFLNKCVRIIKTASKK